MAALAEKIEVAARACVESHEAPDDALEDVVALRPLFVSTLALLEREVNPPAERRPALGFGRRAAPGNLAGRV